MLPGVDAQQGLKVAGDRVLVGAGDEGEVAGGLVLDDPGPAGALDASEGSVGLLLEVLKGAEVLVDGSLWQHSLVSRMLRVREDESYKGKWVESYQELALGLTTTALAVGGEVLPEEGVVDVTTAVEVE